MLTVTDCKRDVISSILVNDDETTASVIGGSGKEIILFCVKNGQSLKSKNLPIFLGWGTTLSPNPSPHSTPSTDN